MPSVLLTRPHDDSENLARALTRQGYQSFLEPLLTVRPMKTAMPDLTHLQAVMLTSANALVFLDRKMCEAAGILQLPCFCVGSRTAEAAKLFGFRDVRDVAGDGLAVANEMHASLQPAAGVILHITGRDSDGRGRDALKHHGFDVRVWVTYAAEAARDLSAETIRLLRDAKLDAVLLFSTRTAETLRTLIVQHGLEACCQAVIALGISGSVCAAVDDLPWRRLEAAPMPTEDAVLRRLHELLPVSEVP